MKNYIVIEVEDTQTYLTEVEQLRLSNLIEKICDGRQEDNRSRVPEIQHRINE